MKSEQNTTSLWWVFTLRVNPRNSNSFLARILIYFHFSDNERFFYVHLATIKTIKDFAFSLRVLLIAKLKFHAEIKMAVFTLEDWGTTFLDEEASRLRWTGRLEWKRGGHSFGPQSRQILSVDNIVEIDGQFNGGNLTTFTSKIVSVPFSHETTCPCETTSSSKKVVRHFLSSSVKRANYRNHMMN